MTSTANTDMVLAWAYIASAFIAARRPINRTKRRISSWLDRIGSETR